MLKLDNIKKDYAAGENTVHALKGIGLQFRRSEFVAILGPSGCGKTTLLNIIGGLDHYTSGDLVINGKSTKEFSDSDWDSYRNHAVGFVFQTYNLIPHQTVLRNVELALTLSGVSKSERRARAKAALESVGLGDQLHKKPNQMSGGQMQRVAIARSLVNDPDILLADEPTGALDSETSVQVMEILKEISRDRLIVMVTHNAELAEAYATRIVRLKDGEVISDSAPFDAAEETEAPTAGRVKKPSLRFGTALGLSFNNLMTKKGRTFLTAFAGSIGIIGIALILSLSNGIQTYIDRVQQDTLSSYPITLEAERMDMSSLVTSLMGVNGAEEEGEGGHELDAVYSNAVLYDLMNTLASTETKTNDLKAFKTYLESPDNGISEYASAVQYSYDLRMDIYAKDTKGKIFKSDVTDLLQKSMAALYGGDYSSYFDQFGGAYSRMDVWEEMLPPEDRTGGELVSDLLYSQYDLLYGTWPQRYDEAVLIVNRENEISDLVIYCMGLDSQDDVVSSMQKLMNGEQQESYQEHWSYEDICSASFKVVLPAEYYQYDTAAGAYSDVSATDAGMDFLFNADNVGTAVKIVGVLRPSADAVSANPRGAIGYTAALTDYLVRKSEGMEILLAQKADPATDVIAGLPFLTDDYTVTDEEKLSAVLDYFEAQPASAKADAYLAVSSVPSEEYLDSVVAEQMKDMTREFIEAQVMEQYAAQMGVDAATVRDYVSKMDDETLFGYVADAVREQAAQQYAAAVEAQMAQLTNDQLALMFDLAAGRTPETPSDPIEAAAQAAMAQQVQPFTAAQFNWLYDNELPPMVSDRSYEENLKLLGDVDYASPKTINLYAASFADKDRISDAIEAYNDSVDKDLKIEYTDFVALLMSSITTIINAISYVLIAFVAISLVVSSIMIGIITYISVLERTKEIGILRAIGASKRDVARVFNAETLTIGLGSGLIGIAVTLLLILPINLIVHRLTNIPTLNAILPPAGAVILVCISMLLTYISGLIPAGIAARKDPVEALRTE